MVLFGTQELITEEVNRCLLQAGPRGHILNVGHGVVQVRAEGGGGQGAEAAQPRRGTLCACIVAGAPAGGGGSPCLWMCVCVGVRGETCMGEGRGLHG